MPPSTIWRPARGPGAAVVNHRGITPVGGCSGIVVGKSAARKLLAVTCAVEALAGTPLGGFPAAACAGGAGAGPPVGEQADSAAPFLS